VIEPEAVDNIVVRSWRVFRMNPIIVAPGVVFGFVTGILALLFAPAPLPDTTAFSWSLVVANLPPVIAIVLVSLVGYMATVAFTTGMAAAAWRNGTTTIADGVSAFRRDGRHVAVATLGLVGIAIVAVILAVPTLLLSVFAAVVMFMYVMPAAVVDDMPGFAAIAVSFRIAKRRFGVSLLIAVGIAALQAVVGVVSGALAHIPFLGPVVQAILDQAAVAFATVVVVGEYINLRSAEAPATFVS
jgi:hypothetical protein